MFTRNDQRMSEELFKKRIALTKWLSRDISTWSAKRIHAVYDQERRKRVKLFMQDYLP